MNLMLVSLGESLAMALLSLWHPWQHLSGTCRPNHRGAGHGAMCVAHAVVLCEHMRGLGPVLKPRAPSV